MAAKYSWTDRCGNSRPPLESAATMRAATSSAESAMEVPCGHSTRVDPGMGAKCRHRLRTRMNPTSFLTWLRAGDEGSLGEHAPQATPKAGPLQLLVHIHIRRDMRLPDLPRKDPFKPHIETRYSRSRLDVGELKLIGPAGCGSNVVHICFVHIVRGCSVVTLVMPIDRRGDLQRRPGHDRTEQRGAETIAPASAQGCASVRVA